MNRSIGHILNNHFKKSQAFTIVELLVVIVVIGILAAITIVSYSGIVNRARVASISAELSGSAKTLNMYYVMNGMYPYSVDGSGCPLTPVADTSNCIKFGENSFNYNYYSETKTYCLATMINSLLYHISSTDNSIIAGDCSTSFYWKVLALGGENTCAIASDDKVYCWGANESGQLGNGSNLDSATPVAVTQGVMPAGAIKQLAVGFGYSCVIASDDRAYCWGGNSYTAVSQGVMPAGAIKQLVAGYGYACVIASDDKAYCWGMNTFGQLGNGSNLDSATPVAVSQGSMPAGAIKQLTSSGGHTCAIASDDKAYCWGNNGGGQLGNGSTVNSATPVAVSQGSMPAGATKQLVAGIFNTCAIASDDKAYCWGMNTFGQLGNGSTVDSATPVAVSQGVMPAGAVKQLATGGGTHTCAIASDDKAYCWGSNSIGQLGDNSSENRNTPVAISQGDMSTGVVKKIAIGYGHTCAIASDDKVYCWGSNDKGQLGDGSVFVENHTPVAVSQGSMPAGAIKQLEVGYFSSCAIASDDKVYCWGQNPDGILGNGSTEDSASPVAVSQGSMPAGAIKSITIGLWHACAIASDDKAYCWGYGSDGQLGSNSMTQSSVPVAVSQGSMPAGAIKQLEAGRYNTCAIASDDKAYCWGHGVYGQLGNGSAENSSTPVAVSQGSMPAGAIKSITVGLWHSCAIASDNKAYCWGLGRDGQLGNGSTEEWHTPVAVSQGSMPAGAIKQLEAADEEYTCAIASDDKVYCWGVNEDSQLGNGTYDSSATPVAVSQGSMPSGAIKQLEVGNRHVCAIASDDKAYCWGGNLDGQFGNGSTVGSSAPVAVSQGAMPARVIKQIAVGQYTCAIASDNKAYCWGASAVQLGVIILHSRYFSPMPNQVIQPNL